MYVQGYTYMDVNAYTTQAHVYININEKSDINTVHVNIYRRVHRYVII